MEDAHSGSYMVSQRCRWFYFGARGPERGPVTVHKTFHDPVSLNFTPGLRGGRSRLGKRWLFRFWLAPGSTLNADHPSTLRGFAMHHAFERLTRVGAATIRDTLKLT